MNAIREIVKSVDQKIIIDLPDGFSNVKEFEVIILPMDEIRIKEKNRKDLLGKYEGKISISDDFNEPLEDFKEYMV
jgi:hypothetical protein